LRIEALIVSTEEVGVEVNAEKSQYTCVSHPHNARKDHNIRTDNKSLENVANF
jgi:hypothetical protein